MMFSIWIILINVSQLLLLLCSLFDPLHGVSHVPAKNLSVSTVIQPGNAWTVNAKNPVFKNLPKQKHKRRPFRRGTQRKTTHVPIANNMSVLESCCDNHGSVANFTIANTFSNRQSPIVYVRPPSLTPSFRPVFYRHLDVMNKSRSEQKCIEYNVAVPNMTPPGTDANRMRRAIGPQSGGAEIHVVGGRRGMPQEFPHIVALGKKNSDKKFSLHCGGSLIAARWVLTAAHCTHGADGGVKIARLGIQRLSGNDGKRVSIKRAIRHPSYKPPAMYADIALLELRKPVTFSRTIKPAYLHQEYHVMSRFAWVAGWGVTEYGGDESDTLQVAMLEVIPNVQCAKRHKHSISVPDGLVPSMVCAGTPRNNWRQDTCSGDSGGPLQFVHAPYGHLHQIIGITSFGCGCAIFNSPGVYTRVSHYLDWIEDIVWPKGTNVRPFEYVSIN